MHRRLVFFKIILLFIFVGCDNITINNINHPSPQNEETAEKTQMNKKDPPKEAAEKNAPTTSHEEKLQKTDEIAHKLLGTDQITKKEAYLEDVRVDQSLGKIPADTKLHVKDTYVDAATYEIWKRTLFCEMHPMLKPAQ